MKLLCTECDWRGDEGAILKAANPFDETEEIYGCPECKAVDKLRGACDEPDCWLPITCGTPTPTVYRWTCGKHRPQ